jgi:hypothetical protein
MARMQAGTPTLYGDAAWASYAAQHPRWSPTRISDLRSSYEDGSMPDRQARELEQELRGGGGL